MGRSPRRSGTNRPKKPTRAHTLGVIIICLSNKAESGWPNFLSLQSDAAASGSAPQWESPQGSCTVKRRAAPSD